MGWQIAMARPLLKAPIKVSPSTGSGRTGYRCIAPMAVRAELVEALIFFFIPSGGASSKPRLNHVFAQVFRAGR